MVAQLVKNPPAMQETWVLSLGWEDPLEKGKVTHSSILAWRIPWTTVHGVAKSRAWLSDFTFTFHFHALEKEMATHSSILAWRNPGTEEPSGLPSMGSQSRTWLKWLSSSSSSLQINCTEASLIAQSVKNMPAMQETWVRSLGQEDPLEKEMATGSSILAWKIPWTVEPGGLQSTGSQRVGHDWATNTSKRKKC